MEDGQSVNYIIRRKLGKVSKKNFTVLILYYMYIVVIVSYCHIIEDYARLRSIGSDEINFKYKIEFKI